MQFKSHVELIFKLGVFSRDAGVSEQGTLSISIAFELHHP
jgi:hypothetical protein